MTSTTTSATVNVFARQGIPNEVVPDNGPQFISVEFKQFMALNEIFVQSFKRAIKSVDNDKSTTLNQTLCAFLLKYRTALHATTN